MNPYLVRPFQGKGLHTMGSLSYTAIVEKEGSGFVSLCPELDVASQGETVESATANLKEAVELFLDCADATEIERRLHTEVFVTRFEGGAWVSSTSSPGETPFLTPQTNRFPRLPGLYRGAICTSTHL